MSGRNGNSTFYKRLIRMSSDRFPCRICNEIYAVHETEEHVKLRHGVTLAACAWCIEVVQDNNGEHKLKCFLEKLIKSNNGIIPATIINSLKNLRKTKLSFSVYELGRRPEGRKKPNKKKNVKPQQASKEQLLRPVEIKSSMDLESAANGVESPNDQFSPQQTENFSDLESADLHPENEIPEQQPPPQENNESDPMELNAMVEFEQLHVSQPQLIPLEKQHPRPTKNLRMLEADLDQPLPIGQFYESAPMTPEPTIPVGLFPDSEPMTPGQNLETEAKIPDKPGFWDDDYDISEYLKLPEDDIANQEDIPPHGNADLYQEFEKEYNLCQSGYYDQCADPEKMEVTENSIDPHLEKLVKEYMECMEKDEETWTFRNAYATIDFCLKADAENYPVNDIEPTLYAKVPELYKEFSMEVDSDQVEILEEPEVVEVVDLTGKEAERKTPESSRRSKNIILTLRNYSEKINKLIGQL